MKLRNLILGGLAICSMVSCSKDEVDIYANGPIDASLSFGAVAALESKAAGYGEDDLVGIENEANVKTLDVYIFKGNTLHVYKRYPESGTIADGSTLLANDFAIQHLTVKIGRDNETFTMYLVANCNQIAETNLEKFQNKSIANDVTTYALGDYMPMVSEGQTFESKKLEPLNNPANNQYAENWVNQGGAIESIIGGSHDALKKPDKTSPIQITRQISRVQVESLEVKFAEGVSGSFALKNLSLVNVPCNVTLGGTGVLPWVKTYQSDVFEIKDSAIVSKADTKNGKFYDNVNSLNNKLTIPYQGKSLTSGTITFGEDKNEYPKFYAYTFPNNENLIAEAVDGITKAQNYQTILLITGLYKVSEADPGSLKHFRIPIETPGKTTPLVEPNHIYLVKVKITGQGSTNEDEYEYNAHVSATITVAPWKVVIQNEEDTN